MIARAVHIGKEAVARWEPFTWGAILLVAICARLWDLGTRVMSHDESLHAFSSFELFAKGVYRHDPAYHGPLLYHINAAVYYLFGASDVTARLAPALTGTLLVAAIWLFRPLLGRLGAAVAAALIAASPTLLFYSRYIREDIYVVLFTVIWVYGAFRYLDDRRPRPLFVVTAAMALSFITKESSFITGAVVGSFFALYALWPTRHRGAGTHAAAGDLAVLMFALVLPFTAGPVYVALGWDPLDRDPGSAALLRGALLGGGLLALSAAMAWWRLPRMPWVRLLALFWTIQVVFFTGFFTNPVGGLITGVAGSVGYWLTQHEVARGSQPPFYYLVIGGLYEFLPLLAGVPAIVVLARRCRNPACDPVPAADLPAGAPVERSTRHLFVLFTIWWTIGSWIAFGWAGERMPWLLAHQVLPLILLAGWGIARLLPSRTGASIPRGAAFRCIGATAVALILLVGLLVSIPPAGRDLQSVADAASWWTRALLLALVLPVLAIQLSRTSRQEAFSMVALGILLVLGLHTLRASIQLTYVNYDMATEPMSYAQASPDVRRAMRTIEAISERTAGAHQLAVAFDDESTWPFVWYLRNYPNARTWGTQPELARSAPVILAGGKNLGGLQPYVSGYERRTYVLYWWPLQGYAELTPASLWASLLDPAFRRHIWRVFTRRDYGVPVTEWPLRREIEMFVRSDVAAAAAGPLRAGSPGSASPRVEGPAFGTPDVFSGPFAGMPLRNPTGVTVAADGAWVVADGGNHRVVVLEPGGSLRMVIGGAGQFNEPWGVAAAPNGELFVADTWNGRIQKFDRRGALLDSWGRWGQVEAGAAEGPVPSLYGPRGLALDGGGNLVAADTGNKRVLVFDESGRTSAVVGPSAPQPLYFDEPTSIASDANGTLLVADAWNARIVRLDNRHHAIGSWPVPGWRSRSAEDKPSVAVDGAGLVYASDPESGRVFVFTPSGILETILHVTGGEGTGARPTGIAIDPAQGRLLVLDHRGGRLLVYPPYRSDR